MDSQSARAAVLIALLVGGSSAIGPQDITGRMARHPGIAERARLTILSNSLHTLKLASFAWPAGPSLISGSVIGEPPAASLQRADANHRDKTNLLPLDEGTRSGAGPLGLAGRSTGAGTGGVSLVGSGSSTGGTGTAGTGKAGLGTAGAGTTDQPDMAGIGTEIEESEGGEEDTPDIAARHNEGIYSLSAGDPTGDPTQLEADGPAVALGGDTDAEDATIGTTGRSEGAETGTAAAADDHLPLYRQSAFIFGYDSSALPPQPFLHLDGGEGEEGGSGTLARGEADATARVSSGPSPAERLGLDGKRRERSEKCLAEAVYFESRGEPVRGQVAVAQVVMNRVFSGYYPADICRAVYQNANRKFACQFTFACDNVRDLVTEPRLWKQARQIAADMLDGLIWDEKVGRATHYHAQSVHPRWIREMRQLDQIGEHTFYRPRRWTG
ncbi:cell wall hydrolase [Ancylobacter amanitiformis]|uniref:Cell wall hydrolase SleB domain-containing protein n=1 Tax=Ancylobacter amanitiformis TaxID=217069 RepID=A0ABU0LTQ9_9HYPH|nr:cell wall hydrolase [Ancylobacter amanitiformis]MDQ0512010.1 hypothetical protein [Ancylobacter amanitiformis]